MNFFDFRAVNEQVCEMYAQSCKQWIAVANAAQDAMSAQSAPQNSAKAAAVTTGRAAPAIPAGKDEAAVVFSTRKHLLQSTTFLTKVAAAIEAFYARVNETLLYVRMLEAQTALTRQMMQMASASHALMATFANSLVPQERAPQHPASPLFLPAASAFLSGPSVPAAAAAQSMQNMAYLSEAALASVPVMALIAGITSAYQDFLPKLAEAFTNA